MRLPGRLGGQPFHLDDNSVAEHESLAGIEHQLATAGRNLAPRFAESIQHLIAGQPQQRVGWVPGL